MSTGLLEKPNLETTNSRESFLNMFTRKLTEDTDSTSVFGKPIEREGVTVIPVARMIWAFGGGGGVNQNPNQEGQGGAGLVTAQPVGFIEIRQGKAIYHPIFNLVSLLGLMMRFNTLILLAFGKRKIVVNKAMPKEAKKAAHSTK